MGEAGLEVGGLDSLLVETLKVGRSDNDVGPVVIQTFHKAYAIGVTVNPVSRHGLRLRIDGKFLRVVAQVAPSQATPFLSPE